MITTTDTKNGAPRGAVEEGVVVFRGMPYAELRPHRRPQRGPRMVAVHRAQARHLGVTG